MDNKDFETLLMKYNVLDQVFDNVRMVDPVNNMVMDLKGETAENTDVTCFSIFGKNQVCENCIAVRAYHDNKTYVKLEYSDDDIYMVTAIPVNLPDRRIVVEILKNATNVLVLDTGQSPAFTEIRDLIDRMNNLAVKDSLTNLYNRRYINERLPIEISNATLFQTRLAIVMADIDFFKKVNDTYGHLNGDCTLKQFAQILSSGIKRGTDWIARFGGEEFMICFPGASKEKAIEIAESIRKKVEESIIDCGDHKFQITASFGISTQQAGQVISMEELINNADKKLYDAKRNGRNRVEA